MDIAIPSTAQAEVTSYLERLGNYLQSSAHLDPTLPQEAPKFQAMADRIGEQSRRYREPFRLVVAGEFNAGKSSIINCLLGEKDLLHVGVTPTTGAITELWYGTDDHGEVWVDGRQIASGTRDEIASYADQRTEEGRGIANRRATIRLVSDSAVLKDLIIVDTPGLGASPRDDEITKENLYLADAAIVVVSARQPGSEATKRLAEWLRMSRRRVLAAVTRLDLIGDREDALRPIREQLGDCIEGEPIGIIPPAALEALAMFEDADISDDDEAKDAAQTALADTGYHELVQSIQDSLLLGDAAGRRRTLALSTAHLALDELLAIAGPTIKDLGSRVDAVEGRLSETQRTVNLVLRPKIPYLNGKIVEIAEAEIHEFISDLSSAVEVFLERVSTQTLTVGFRAVGAMVTRRKEQFSRQLQKEFEEIFAPSQFDITLAAIHRSVTNLLLAEWEGAAAEITGLEKTDGFDTGSVARQVADQLAVVAASLTAAALAGLLFIFVPGGPLVELAAVLLSASAATTGKGMKKSRERLAMHQREARVRLRGQRRDASHAVAEHYLGVNQAIGERIITKALESGAEARGDHQDLLASLQEWTLVDESLRRWRLGAEQLSLGEPMG
ncbi:MAG: dynamin family protein [Acidimicrobiia bacterium]